MRKTLSVIVPVYNVAPIIERCLDSLAFADEVVVVDSHSTDGTEEVCRHYPNVVFLQNQDYPEAKANFGIDHASGHWMMRHDSDEVIPPALRDEILEVLEKDGDGYDGFFIAQKTFFFGRWIMEGVPGKSGREKLFRRGHFRYPGKRMHEPAQITGRWGYLKNYYLHYSHPTVSGWLAKMNYYTDHDVAQTESIDPKLFRWYRFISYPAKVFRYYYFTVGLRREGFHGYILSLLHAVYALVEKIKLWEKHRKATHSPDGDP